MDVIKPVVAIQLARKVRVPRTDTFILIGYPVNHPRGRLNDKLVQTSTIIDIDGDKVETRNTIYDVMSWDPDGQ